MCETKFLQIRSYSIILTSLHYLSFLFPLLFYVISTAIFKRTLMQIWKSQYMLVFT